MDQITYLAPEVILADDNKSRFGLIDTRVESLMEAIEEAGQVNEALEVEELSEPVDGCNYRVTVGHYRHAASLRLNSEKGAGLTIPCIVKQRDEKDRLLRQVSENNDRQNLTPMDSAVAIKAMLDAGIPRMDIRKRFARPNVKGKILPCSNSFLNMMVSFLDLPKSVQNKIHSGFLPVRSAYELTKPNVPKDKREDIVALAEKERQSEYAWEDKIEEKFLADERRAEESRKKQEEAVAAATAAKEAAAAAEAELEEKRKQAIAAYEAAKLAKESEEKKKAEEVLKAAEKASQEAEKTYTTAAAQAKKAADKIKSAEELAKERADRLKKAKDAAAKKKGPTAENIKSATAKVTGAGIVSKTSREIKDILDQMRKPNGDAPKLQAIGKAFYACFYGDDGATSTTTVTQLMSELRKIVGETPKKTKAA